MSKPTTLDEFAAVPLKEKIMYFVGEMGSGAIFYYLILTLSTFFYTDVLKISATTIGLIVVISRIFDGVSDLIVGSLIDRTRHKWGKARPWFFFTTFPYALSMVLLYCVPAHAEKAVQVAFIIITYNLAVTICYTLNNIPWGALPSMMTRNQSERSVLYSLRMVASPIGSAIGVGTALPLITYLGGTQADWIKVMTMFAIIGAALNIIVTFTVKERVKHEPAEKGSKQGNRLDIPSAVRNPYWWVMIVITTIYSVFLVGFSTLLTYYCTYFLGDTLITSTVNTIQSVAMAATAFACVFLTKKVKKSTLVKFGMLIVIPGQILMAISPLNLPVIYISTVIRGVGWGFLGAVMFSMTADAIEYGHWRTGHRAEGTTYTASGIGNKLGVLIGGGIFTMLLGAAGYDGSLAVQSESAMSMIKALFIYSPLFFAIIVFVIMLFYKVDKMYDGIIRDLLAGKYHPNAKYAPKADE